MSAYEDLRQAIEVVAAEDGEIVVAWTLTAEISRPDGGRHLANRSGTVGDDSPYVWQVIGMLEGALVDCRTQMARITREHDDGEEGGT